MFCLPNTSLKILQLDPFIRAKGGTETPLNWHLISPQRE